MPQLLARSGPDEDSGLHIVRRIDDDLVAFGNSGKGFELGAKIAAGFDFANGNLVVFAYDGNVSAIAASDNRISRHHERTAFAGSFQRHFYVHARKQQILVIYH